MRRAILFCLFAVLLGCNAEEKSRRRIESLEKLGPDRKYEIGMACMQYISRHGNNEAYSKDVVKKLLDLQFHAEAILAVDWLMQRYPGDAELFYLRGLAYSNLHQYDLAVDDFRRAVELRPDDDRFSSMARKVERDYGLWKQIQSLNESLMTSSDSFDIILKRADHLFAIQQYDAVLYDLGSLSKMSTSRDSLYYSQKVSALYKDVRRPVETLSEMLDYFRKVGERR